MHRVPTSEGPRAPSALLFAGLLALATAACGPGGGGGPNGNGNGNGTGNGTNGNGEIIEDPILIEGEFSLEPFTEIYRCVRLTVEEDLWITRITPIAPMGTHHTVLAVDTGGLPDGNTVCGPFDRNWSPLFASGIGSPHMNMPEGVALKIPAGEQIVLNLHLYNPTEEVIEGVAGLTAAFAEPEEIQYEAGVVLAGPFTFTVPPGPEEVITGQCTLQQDTNFFALFPHMHQYGRWMRVWADEELVFDGAFDFEHQDFVEFEPIPMAQGKHIRVECTYENLTGSSIDFGDSSDEEMCFAISYLFPWEGQGFMGYCGF